MEKIAEVDTKVFVKKIQDTYFLNKEVEPPQLYVSIIRYNNIRTGEECPYAFYILKEAVDKAMKQRVFCLVIESQFFYYTIDLHKFMKRCKYYKFASLFYAIDRIHLNKYVKNTYDKDWERVRKHVLNYQRIYKNVTRHKKKHRNENFNYKNTKEVVEEKRKKKRAITGKQGSLF